MGENGHRYGMKAIEKENPYLSHQNIINEDLSDVQMNDRSMIGSDVFSSQPRLQAIFKDLNNENGGDSGLTEGAMFEHASMLRNS